MQGKSQKALKVISSKQALTERKVYTSPTIVPYGNIKTLTQGSMSPGSDGGASTMLNN
jgi:hypothetical protein